MEHVLYTSVQNALQKIIWGAFYILERIYRKKLERDTFICNQCNSNYLGSGSTGYFLNFSVFQI